MREYIRRHVNEALKHLSWCFCTRQSYPEEVVDLHVQWPGQSRQVGVDVVGRAATVSSRPASKLGDTRGRIMEMPVPGKALGACLPIGRAVIRE